MHLSYKLYQSVAGTLDRGVGVGGRPPPKKSATWATLLDTELQTLTTMGENRLRHTPHAAHATPRFLPCDRDPMPILQPTTSNV